MDQGRRELARPADFLPAARLQAATARARTAFWQGFGRTAQTLTLNKDRRLKLEAAGVALGGRFPFFKLSPTDGRRVIPSESFQPP